MKILLTGATGFIGSSFARLALSRGHQVAGLIIPGEAIPKQLPAGPSLTWFRGTLGQAPWPDITAFAADACVHAAWITTPGIYLESSENERFRDASLEFLSNLVGSGTRYILGLGTCIEYQNSNQRLVEDTALIAPTTTYARCKDELRQALEVAAKRRGFTFCWGRVFYPYGPGEHPSRLCSGIIQKLARGETITLKTPQSTKDYIFIDDLARAILVAAERRFSGAINFGTGVGTSVLAIAQHLGFLVGRSDLIQAAAKPELDPFPFVVADASRVKSLGWSPAVTVEDGLRRLATVVMETS